MRERRAFGELELSIIAAVREHPGSSVKEVQQRLGGVSGYTTIMTVLNRLVAKGELSREKEGRRFLYWVDAPSGGALRRIKQQVFGGRVLPMVRALVEGEEVSAEELAEIQRMIAKAKRGRK